MVNKLSTSALAKQRGISAKQLFETLANAGYINRYQEQWLLTPLGTKMGGEYAQHKKFGQFIAWPANLIIDLAHTAQTHLSATQIGERLKLNAKKVNQLLNELGWMEKGENGWQLTQLGASVGGQQKQDKASQHYFIVWHDSIIKNKRFKQSVTEFLGQDAELHATDKSISSFRQKFEAKHRTLDGHYVRTVGELLIDNWLYVNGIVHAYARQLPIEDDMVCDFYLPAGKVYLQYWSEAHGAQTESQRQQVRDVYHQHNFALIEVSEQEVHQLDEVLPKRLRRYGIHAY